MPKAVKEHIKRMVLLSIISIGLAACASSPGMSGSAVPLTGDEIRGLLVGNSIIGKNWDGPYTVYFPTYGEMRGLRSSHYKDQGTWYVVEDAICGEWENWWGSVERCWGIYLEGDTITWLRPDSDAPDVAEIVEGNPAFL